MILHPTHFTVHEGGKWHNWISGSITDEQLEEELEPPNDMLHHVSFNNIMFHSLSFITDGAGGHSARWDCINGWTTTLEQAAKNNKE